MNLRETYGSEELDGIFMYFMRTALRLQKTGVEDLPIPFEGREPVKNFLELAVKLLIEGATPSDTDLILQTEYNFLLSTHPDKSILLALHLIKTLSEHMHYDRNCFDYLLTTSNLWQDRANQYAYQTFFPNLAEDVQKRIGYDQVRAHLPEEMIKPEDY